MNILSTKEELDLSFERKFLKQATGYLWGRYEIMTHRYPIGCKKYYKTTWQNYFKLSFMAQCEARWEMKEMINEKKKEE